MGLHRLSAEPGPAGVNLTDIRISAPRPAIATDHIARLGNGRPSRARVLCPVSADNRAASPEHLRGGEDAIRFTPISLPPVVILGPGLALVQGQPIGRSQDMPGVRLDDIAAVRILSEVFDSIWAAAQPATTSSVPVGALNHAETTLLRLLADGLTYAAIARRQAISSRTVDRRVVQLLARLGARNRFEAVREATRLGFL